VRRVVLDAVRRDPRIAAAVIVRDGSPVKRAAVKVAVAPMGVGVRAYYRVSDATVERAWERIDAAIDRFQAELQPSGYLVGDGFSVADLTFAALVGASVQPEGFPYPAAEPERRGLPEMRSLLTDRGVLEWIEDMYARHRGSWTRA
jgi:hypothetical protein